jgi:hypothetical protein
MIEESYTELDPVTGLATMDAANVSALYHHHQQGCGPPSFGGGARPPRGIGTRGGFTMEKPIACPHAPCAGL